MCVERGRGARAGVCGGVSKRAGEVETGETLSRVRESAWGALCAAVLVRAIPLCAMFEVRCLCPPHITDTAHCTDSLVSPGRHTLTHTTRHSERWTPRGHGRAWRTLLAPWPRLSGLASLALLSPTPYHRSHTHTSHTRSLCTHLHRTALHVSATARKAYRGGGFGEAPAWHGA